MPAWRTWLRQHQCLTIDKWTQTKGDKLFIQEGRETKAITIKGRINNETQEKQLEQKRQENRNRK